MSETSNSLFGKAGIVTGAGTGIGRASALAMAREGAMVMLVGRRLEPLTSVQREIVAIGGRAEVFQADVATRDGIRDAVQATAEEFGSLDLAFNNAGGHGDFKPIDETPDDEAEWVIDLNFKGVYWALKYQVQLMRKSGGGSIVNSASIFGLKGASGLAHYAASKFAVVGLTRSVALECAAADIRVNAVAPGGTNTPNFLRVTGGSMHAMDDIVPMGRIAEPHEIANAVVWLMSAQASYVNGTVLSIDGGMWAG